MGTNSDWEWFGRHDPYFGVYSHQRFRGATRGGSAREEFFRSGEEHVAQILATAGELFPGLAPGRALDFGCGVGRLVLPLAKRVEQVVGVDVSASMIEEARRNCAEAGITNALLCVCDDQLSAVEGEFDLIHSFIVFQHIPVTRGLAIFGRLLDHLAPGGVAAVHFTYANRNAFRHRLVYQLRKSVPGLHRMINALRGRPVEPLMQMNCYPLNELFAMLQAHDCHRIGVRFSNHYGIEGAILFAQRQVLPLY
jgi:trans-aconitate methyltransferase